MRLALLCIFFFALCRIIGYAQNQQLQQFKQITDQTFNERQSKARVLASARQMPLEFSTTEGRHYLLVDFQNGIPVYWSGLNSEAAITTNVVNVRAGGATGLNLEGEGMTVGVWDEGLVKQHIELDNRVVATEGSEPKTHATHVTGTLIASGINPLAKGMAPKAKASTWYFDNDLSEMAGIAEAQALLVSNHSYGTTVGWDRVNNVWQWFGDASVATSEDFRFGFYGQRAKSIDELAFAAPYYAMVWAAGNDRSQAGDGTRPPDCNGGTGYDCIIPESVAKNIITVGAVNKVLNYTSPASVSISTFSSGGPTDDGRIKPDLVAAGVNLFSLSANSEDTYTILSGTSMATPNVAGSLLLLQELFQKTHGGKSMRASTLKGLAVHTAREAGPSPGPDYTYGWGLLDAAAAARLISTSDDVNNMMVEATLEQGKTYEVTLDPKANQKITATLCWTDPAGLPVPNSLDPTDLMLVNDLDIELISETGVITHPWILDPNNPAAQATRGNNFRDNVERLEFSLPQAKPYRLIVRHKGQLKNGQQDFSLIVTYTSASAGRVLYWVGDTGNWSDASHWSLNSGGPGNAPVPTANDVVVIDENSFDGNGENVLTLDQPVPCKALRWLRTQSASLRSQGNTITVSREISISKAFLPDDQMKIIALSLEPATGYLNLRTTGFLNTIIQIDGGNWEMDAGEVDQVLLNAGSLHIVNKEITIHQLIAASTQVRSLNLTGSRITLLSAAILSGEQMTIVADNGEFKIASPVVLDWNAVVWNGALNVDGGALILNGENNQIDSLRVAGSMVITGSNQFDNLTAEAGALISLTDGTRQSINDVHLNSSAGTPIVISAPGGAGIELQSRKLYCFDHLSIANVTANGLGLVNAGTNSSLQNAEGWLALPCTDVIFPDFEFRYPCARGLTEFENKSKGPITNYHWTFGEPGAESQQADPSHAFVEPGVYQVALTVSGLQQTRTLVASILINENSLAENSVTTNAHELTSLLGANAYQWLRNGSEIDGATDRTYAYEGQDGAFQVITYDETCNRISLPAIVTAVDSPSRNCKVYPNPANSWLTIDSGPSECHMELRDMVGRVWVNRHAEGVHLISVADLPDGLYILSIDSDMGRIAYKILVQHTR